ncbi:hypothetical protein CHUAL_012847 [Chamberlinius hualienensis]
MIILKAIRTQKVSNCLRVRNCRPCFSFCTDTSKNEFEQVKVMSPIFEMDGFASMAENNFLLKEEAQEKKERPCQPHFNFQCCHLCLRSELNLKI